jgi:hypothetical protein
MHADMRPCKTKVGTTNLIFISFGFRNPRMLLFYNSFEIRGHREQISQVKSKEDELDFTSSERSRFHLKRTNGR